MEDTARIRVGCCITPHGFGHAARGCAVMEALAELCPVCFEIVTTVPDWFFAQSLTVPYTLHPLPCDIGLVQQNAMQEDLSATVRALDEFYPLAQPLVDRAAALFSRCAIVLCDIAPLGIVAARQAGIASLLIENFTWDWIYQPYQKQYPGFMSHITALQELYAAADYHVQAEPVCNPADCNLRTAPIARKRRQSRRHIRQQLQVEEGETLVLVTMGGVPGTDISLASMVSMDQCFVVPGASGGRMEVQGNLRLLPQESDVYHPDLVAACDAVVGKVGYSTLAELYQAGTPFGYITRPGFRESLPLAAYIAAGMASLDILWQEFTDTRWLDKIPELCSLVPDANNRPNGAEEAASFICALLLHPSRGIRT